MPDWYTMIIETKADVTFRDYALRCARAFGACVHQLDEDDDEPPRAREYDGHHGKALETAKAQVKEAQEMADEVVSALWQAECEKVAKENEKHRREHERKRAAYEKMRAEVVAWKAPTPDHERLKAFMLEEIDVSFSHDEQPYQLKVSETPGGYREQLIKHAQWNIEWETKHHAEEVQAANSSKAWLDVLVASLPSPPYASQLVWTSVGMHEEAIVGDFVGGDGVRFTLQHMPTCYRRGPWKLLIEVAGGPAHHKWGCFDDQDQPERWYHHEQSARAEAQALANVLLKDRIAHDAVRERRIGEEG